MDIRREIFGAAFHVATVVSAVAAALTLGWSVIGSVPTTTLVLTVIVIGFVASWVATGRVVRTASRPTGHRIAVVPVRHPVG